MFVVAVGMSPADYWQLTLGQRAAIVDAFNEQNKKR